MRKLTTLLVLLLFAGLQVAFAQRTISGRVTKTTDNTPLAGVTVLVKGTTTGITTDINGRYSIRSDYRLLLLNGQFQVELPKLQIIPRWRGLLFLLKELLPELLLTSTGDILSDLITGCCCSTDNFR